VPFGLNRAYQTKISAEFPCFVNCLRKHSNCKNFSILRSNGDMSRRSDSRQGLNQHVEGTFKTEHVCALTSRCKLSSIPCQCRSRSCGFSAHYRLRTSLFHSNLDQEIEIVRLPAKSMVCLMKTCSNERKRSSLITLSASSLGDVTSRFSCRVDSVGLFDESER
jgi:hypothetical protein